MLRQPNYVAHCLRVKGSILGYMLSSKGKGKAVLSHQITITHNAGAFLSLGTMKPTRKIATPLDGIVVHHSLPPAFCP